MLAPAGGSAANWRGRRPSRGAFGPESSIVVVVRLVLAKFCLREMRRVDPAFVSWSLRAVRRRG
jgi:hypothetical protein